MSIETIDLEFLAIVAMPFILLLVPIMGLTARFALKPTVEAIGQVLHRKGTDEALQLMERRMAMLEQQIDLMEATMRRLDETVQFDRRLTGPAR
jgi:hypothetical protein